MRKGNCETCEKEFSTYRNDRKFCGPNCKVKAFRAKKKAGEASGKVKDEKKGVLGEAIDYARLTFILSVLGFIGSLGFYLGVLREVYSPVSDKTEIRVLKAQNEQLQKTVNVLVIEMKGNAELTK